MDNKNKNYPDRKNENNQINDDDFSKIVKIIFLFTIIFVSCMTFLGIIKKAFSQKKESFTNNEIIEIKQDINDFKKEIVNTIEKEKYVESKMEKIFDKLEKIDIDKINKPIKLDTSNDLEFSGVTNIDVNVISLDVKIEMENSNENRVEVTLDLDSNNNFYINLFGDTLLLEENDKKTKGDIIIKIYSNDFDSLYVNTLSGSIIVKNIENDLIFLNSQSGNISTYNLKTEDLNINTKESEITIENSESNINSNIMSTNGRIYIYNISSPKLLIKTISGEILSKEIITNNFVSRSTSGYQRMGFIYSDDINIDISTVNANIDVFFDKDQNIKNISEGSIFGNFNFIEADDNNFLASSISGKIVVNEKN